MACTVCLLSLRGGARFYSFYRCRLGCAFTRTCRIALCGCLCLPKFLSRLCWCKEPGAPDLVILDTATRSPHRLSRYHFHSCWLRTGRSVSTRVSLSPQKGESEEQTFQVFSDGAAFCGALSRCRVSFGGMCRTSQRAEKVQKTLKQAAGWRFGGFG